MLFFDIIILGLHYLFRNLYYQNNQTYLGFGVDDHSFYSSIMIHSFLSISCLIHIDRILFNKFFGVYIWIIVFVFFFVFLFWIYVIKDRLEKILSIEYSKSIKMRYSIITVGYVIFVFILFFKTIWWNG